MAYYDALRAVAMKVLAEIIGGLAFLLIVASLIAVYSRALGVSVW